MPGILLYKQKTSIRKYVEWRPFFVSPFFGTAYMLALAWIRALIVISALMEFPCNGIWMLKRRYIDDTIKPHARKENDMSFAEDIKKIRRKAFLTQDEFAKQLGVSYTTVNRWETGKAKPTLKTMKLIDDYCKEHGIDFDISEEI